MRQATLVGYHGRRNLGDDIFLRVAVSWLRRRCGIEKVFVAGKRRRLPGKVEGVSLHAFEFPDPVVARFVWVQVLYYALRSDVLLFAAGSIFTIQPFALAYLVTRALRLVKPQLKIIAVGVSVGPLRNSFDTFWCRRLLQLFDSIIVRDVESAEWIEKHVPQAKYTLGYDIALSWQPHRTALPIESKPTVGICVNKARGQASEVPTQQFIQHLVEALVAVSKSYLRLEVLLLAVCSDEHDGDLELTEEFANELRMRGIFSETAIYEGRDPEAYLAHLERCTAIVTSRMHTGILAMMRGVPVLQVAYAPKILQFFAHSGVGSEDLVRLEAVSVAGVATFILEALDGKRATLAERRKKSLGHRGEAVASMLEREGVLSG